MYGSLLLGAVDLKSVAGDIKMAARGDAKGAAAAAAAAGAEVGGGGTLALAAELRMYSNDVITRLPPAESPAANRQTGAH